MHRNRGKMIQIKLLGSHEAEKLRDGGIEGRIFKPYY
jgi:hypothetical protein